MPDSKTIDQIFSDIVTLGSITALAYLAHLGYGDATLLIIAISGLGGYSVRSRNGHSD